MDRTYGARRVWKDFYHRPDFPLEENGEGSNRAGSRPLLHDGSNLSAPCNGCRVAAVGEWYNSYAR
jgi:hypothetical protein